MSNREAIALCISGYAEAWRIGNRAPMDAEMQTYLTREQQRSVEDAVRHSQHPQEDAYKTVMRVLDR